MTSRGSPTADEITLFWPTLRAAVIPEFPRHVSQAGRRWSCELQARARQRPRARKFAMRVPFGHCQYFTVIFLPESWAPFDHKGGGA